ncbi:MAG: hypothetical protein IJO66_01015, partial [Clostridia bacterium]|nr:hypothetical protein [Clostridia bacterium]
GWDSPIAEAILPEMAAQWLDALRQARRADLAVGFSTAGPHREDLTVTILKRNNLRVLRLLVEQDPDWVDEDEVEDDLIDE